MIAFLLSSTLNKTKKNSSSADFLFIYLYIFFAPLSSVLIILMKNKYWHGGQGYGTDFVTTARKRWLK